MKYVKYFAVFFIGIFLISSILPQATAQSDDLTFLDNFLIRFLDWTYAHGLFNPRLEGGKLIPSLFFDPVYSPLKIFAPIWIVNPFMVYIPDVYTAEPSSIDIEYLEETTIVVGVRDPTTGDFKPASKQGAVESVDITFSLDVIGDVPEGAFTYNFDPPIIEFPEPIMTNLTITSNIPLNAALPSDILIQVNVEPWRLWKDQFELWYPYLGMLSPLALLGGFAWRLSGLREPLPAIPVDILVKANRFHLAEIIPPGAIEVKSDELVTIPIEVRNHGSHIDTFNFRAYTKNDSGLIVSPPSALTLNPNEVGRTHISVATPRHLQDPGTAHSINIEAYSIYEPEKVFTNTVSILTRGVYVSEIVPIYSGIFGLIIIFGVALILSRRRRIFGNICKKPDKPWDIPEEKRYLENLKQKDKKEYNKTLSMMEEEYESAILWYKWYCKTMIPPISISGYLAKIFNTFIKIFKRPKKKKIKKLVKKPKVVELVKEPEVVKKFKKEKKPILPEIKKEEIPILPEIKKQKDEEEKKRIAELKAAEQEMRRREKIVNKLQRQQEKQKRRLKKLGV